MRGFKNFSDKHKAVLLFIILTVTSTVTLGFSSNSIAVRPEEVGFSVLSVFQRGLSGIENFFSNTINSIAELKKLRIAHEELKSRFSEYENLQRDLDKYRVENSRLKDELGFSETIKFKFIPAEVIAKDPTDPFSGIIINRGTSSGVNKGQTVISFNNGQEGLVGRIISVSPVTAQILPVTDDRSYVASRLFTSRYQGLVNGIAGNSDILGMKYVKKKARREIQYGDLVVTSGLNSTYPKDIYIGKLVKINSVDWETSLSLEIEPIVDFTKLEYVYVLEQEEESE